MTNLLCRSTETHVLPHHILHPGVHGIPGYRYTRSTYSSRRYAPLITQMSVTQEGTPWKRSPDKRSRLEVVVLLVMAANE